MPVTSVISTILNSCDINSRIVDSRPGPGPWINTATDFIPYSLAVADARSVAICAAYGVLLRDPRKPEPPEVAQHNALP